MKIAYLLHWNDGPHSGVWKKVQAQVKAWSEEGLAVSIHLISRTLVSEDWLKSMAFIQDFAFYTYSNVFERLQVWNQAVNKILLWQPQLIYYRYDLFMPPLYTLFHRLPCIVEVNTDDVREYCLQRGWRCLYNLLTRKFIYGSAAGFIFVSGELERVCSIKNRPRQIIANGIRLDDFPVLKIAQNKFPRLVFIGTENQIWHGVDKILKLAKILREWNFDLIGLDKQAINYLPPNVAVHGFMKHDEYRTIFERSDAAFGTLALHRKGMNEASPLKVREYLAHGLPVIIGYKDTDFIKPVPFILELPNTETNLLDNVESIKTFVTKWKGKRVPRNEIQHLDIYIKERLRIKFFEEVLFKWRH